MTISIPFTLDGHMPVPTVTSVPVVSGNSISLSVADGKAVLYFSPALAAVVSPAPGTSVEIGSEPVEFTFLSSAQGAYFIMAAPEGEQAPSQFGTAPSSHVKIETLFASTAKTFPVGGGGTNSDN